MFDVRAMDERAYQAVLDLPARRCKYCDHWAVVIINGAERCNICGTDAYQCGERVSVPAPSEDSDGRG